MFCHINHKYYLIYYNIIFPITKLKINIINKKANSRII